MSSRCMPCIAALCILCAVDVSAQVSVASTNPFGRGTELAVLVGAATSDSATGGTVGATAGWEVTRWTVIEGRGTWFDRGANASAFSADLSGRLNIVARRDVTPYVAAGFGLYRASFSMRSAPMSTFYRQRMSVDSTESMAFTDPLLRLTAGIDAIVYRHWTVRPEFSALVVRSGGNGETLLGGGVSVGYRFENRPITPAR